MRYLDKHTTRDKHLLRLEREQNPLWRALRDAPVVPLEKPYQLGWTKTYVLERDVLRRPDAEVFARVLKVINRTVWSRGRDFVGRNGGPIILSPRIIPPREWERLGWPASHARLFSYGHWKDETEPGARWGKARLYIGYAVRRLWWLREDVQPRLITHRRVDLPEVRQRIAEIDAYFTHHLGRERLSWLHGQKRHWRERATVAERRLAAQDDRVLDDAAKARGEEWSVSTATIVESIMRLISANPKDDRDKLHMHEVGAGRHRKTLRDTDKASVRIKAPLRDLYLDVRDIVIYGLIVNYLSAVDELFWRNPTPGFIRKTIGIQALFEVLADLLPAQLATKDLTKATWYKLLQSAAKIDFADRLFNASGSGRTRVKKALQLAMGKLTVDDLDSALKVDFQRAIRR